LQLLALARRPGVRPRFRPLRLTVAAVAAVALVALGAAAAPASPTILYVDGGNPSCSDQGQGTEAQPYCTIGKAASTVAPGHTVLVSSGTYSEKVTISGKDASAGSPIVVRPADGASVTVRDKANGFSISSSSYVTIQGFTVTATSGVGIYATDSNHITIAGNHMSYAGHPASGQVAQGIRLSNTSDSLVQGNVTDHNSEAGIQLVNGSTRDTVQGNESFANARGYVRAAPGIDLRSPGNTVVGNSSHDNEDTGIQSYSGTSNELIAGNLTYYNGDHGIDNLGATGQRIIGNTVWWNFTAGINVEGGSRGATVANNVSVDNGYGISPCITPDPPPATGCAARTGSNIRIDKNSTSGTTVDYNLTWLSSAAPATLYIWGSSSYKTLEAFQATGQGAHDIEADPGFASPAGRDFHLSAGSLAIDSANSGVSGQQLTDFDGNGRVDDPATPNTDGAGPRPYDDRGAFEFQPGGPPPDDHPPVAALSLTPASGSAPLGVTADASASTDTDATPIDSYTFDFGDATPVVGPQPGATATHTYTATGSFVVKVTVTDTAGRSSQATASVSVSGGGGGGNLVANSGFETSTAGWNGTPAIDRVAGGHSGESAARLSNTGSSPASCTLNDSPNAVTTTSAGTYTGSVWVRADTPGAIIKLRFREYNASTLVGSTTTTATLTTSWQQVAVTHAPAAAGTSTLDFNAYVSSAPPGTCFYADDASITLG
jgi:parallel beta-helix repeat protein